MADFIIPIDTMKKPFSYKHYDPNRLLDTLQQRLDSRNDQALAQRLHISLKTLEKIRSGDLQLSASLLLCMAESAATSMEELRSIVGDRRRALRLPYRIAA
ncbi:MAG TPA: hypothetical protein VFF81_08145 [Noviherbaspirillum sp.]|nr:hypothetical protein [Noviherbaspirillum sp.]